MRNVHHHRPIVLRKMCFSRIFNENRAHKLLMRWKFMVGKGNFRIGFVIKWMPSRLSPSPFELLKSLSYANFFSSLGICISNGDSSSLICHFTLSLDCDLASAWLHLWLQDDVAIWSMVFFCKLKSSLFSWIKEAFFFGSWHDSLTLRLISSALEEDLLTLPEKRDESGTLRWPWTFP